MNPEKRLDVLLQTNVRFIQNKLVCSLKCEFVFAQNLLWTKLVCSYIRNC